MRVLVSMNNLIAWALGNLRDTEAMRQCVKLGFEGGCSEYLRRYDELGGHHFGAIAATLQKTRPENVGKKTRPILGAKPGTSPV